MSLCLTTAGSVHSLPWAFETAGRLGETRMGGTTSGTNFTVRSRSTISAVTRGVVTCDERDRFVKSAVKGRKIDV